jgi:hypothetical protein
MELEGSLLCLQQPTLVPILSQMHPIHTLPPYFPKIYSSISSHICLGLPSGLFPSGIPTKTFHESLTCATYPIHLTLLDLITLITLGEPQKLQSDSLHNLLQSYETFSLLGPNILLSTLFLNILNLCSSFSMRHQDSQPYKTSKIMVMYILF